MCVGMNSFEGIVDLIKVYYQPQLEIGPINPARSTCLSHKSPGIRVPPNNLLKPPKVLLEPRPHSIRLCSRHAHNASAPLRKRAETPQKVLQRAPADLHLPYTVVHAPEVRRERGGGGPEEQEGGVACVGSESVCYCA